jgi:hypothetical protein
MLINVQKEKLVLDLYYNQHKNVRQIAQEARISFRDIVAILKKKEAAEVNHSGSGNGNENGIVDKQKSNDINNKSPNGRATQAYKLFSESKKPLFTIASMTTIIVSDSSMGTTAAAIAPSFSTSTSTTKPHQNHYYNEYHEGDFRDSKRIP